MSEGIDHHAGLANGLFASLVERERGLAGRLVPRLPTMFEASPADEAPEALAEHGVVDVPRDTTRDQDPARAADVGTGPERSARSPVEGAPVRYRHEMVHVERQVLRERHDTSTPGDVIVGSQGSPRADPSPPGGHVSQSVERRLPWQGEARPEPRRAPRPADDDPPLRPVSTEPAVRARDGSDDHADREQGSIPIVGTRREVGVPRPEPDRAPLTPPRAAEPVVQVSIGRLEIRAVPDPASPKTRRPERQIESLDEYLVRRNQGGRS